MSFPVRLTLYRNGSQLDEIVAEKEEDLRLPIEMDTGTGWLDAAELYHALLDEGCEQLSDTLRVCHSYEKWGGMQQEVLMVRVRVQRIRPRSGAKA